MADLPRNRTWRVAAGAVFVLVALAQVARTVAVDLDVGNAFGQDKIWPGNPAELSSRIMAEVGQSAAQGRAPGDQTLTRLEQLAAKEPLTPQPFLVHGAMAVREEDYARAERLLTLARQRGPRSPAARYLLSDLYLRTNRPVPAMAEMAVLNRLLPAGSLQLAPSLAAYARTPGAIPQIKTILTSYPELEEPLLAAMSSDVANADAMLQLASSTSRRARAPVWQGLLLTNLVSKGQYRKAFATWRQLSGVGTASAGLYNPQFEPNSAPPPFNWRLAQGAGAVVEPNSGGLQVLYFGRDILALANQVVLLPPGLYRLTMNVSGSLDDGSGVAWRVKCLPGGAELMKLRLSRSGPVRGEFEVPAGKCEAQEIALIGETQEIPDRAEFRLSGLQLSPRTGS